ncbi:MAG TPA: M48 family metalloprotease [Verrucomicrobiae bacterium]|nr:M48 family metalloprotease [Verrucomicrobiae bacterium]
MQNKAKLNTMTIQLETLAMARWFSLLFLPAAIFLLPMALAFWFRGVALRADEPVRKIVWARFRGYGRFILIAAAASWWAIWELHGPSEFMRLHPGFGFKFLYSDDFETFLFWIPPVVSLGVFLLTCHLVDRRLLKLHWSVLSLLWRTWWRLASFVIPLLMFAAGCDDLMERQVWGIAWFLAAGVVARIGTPISRRADGLKLNKLKSGEIRNRTLHIAKEMGVAIDRVYIVPAGKGHLTNGFGVSNAVGLTDNLGKYLTREQTAYVIAHELTHAKLKHVRNSQLFVIGTYACVVLVLFLLSRFALQVKPLLCLASMVIPLLLTYWVSRRQEYAADQGAIDFTGDPESAIRALAILQKTTELPTQSNRFTELLMTHPPFRKRIRAMALHGNLTEQRLRGIFLDEQIAEA